MDKKFWLAIDVLLDTAGLTFEILAFSGIIPIGTGIASMVISTYHLIRTLKKK